MSERLIKTQSGERSVINPLECQLCHMELVQPVRLCCQHYFCRQCLSTPECPLCGAIVDGELIEDSVLSYVIESFHERTEICANCDQVVQPMFFCETCQQPLCCECRALTHKAKIFSSHNIAPLEERGRLRGRVVCDVHNEPFIVFCQELKKLMCIECFNTVSSVKRGSFLNVDSAHKFCCDKLEKATAQLRFFHDDVIEQIELRRCFITELDNNFNAHIQELETSFETLIEFVTRIKTSLMSRLNEEKAQKQLIVNEQLRNLENLQGPILANLLSASIFCSYASKIDLLHYFSDLSKAIEQIVSKRTEKLALSSDCFVDYRRELAKELSANFLVSTDNLIKAEDGATIQSLSAAIPIESSSIFPSFDGHVGDLLNFDFSDNEFSQKFSSDVLVGCRSDFTSGGMRFLPDLNATFNEKMQQVSAPMIGFFERISTLSKELVNMQRDITLRRCLINNDNFINLSNSCNTLKNEVKSHHKFVNNLQPMFRELWQKHIQRIREQQILYCSKLDELSHLQRFAVKIFDSAQQLQPFALYIASIVEVIDVRRTQTPHVSPMEQICMQISSLEPDSHQRIDAIEREEDTRRIAKLQESLACIPEAQQVKKELKEIKPPNKVVQAVVVPENRDRSSFIPTTKLSTSRHKSKRENRTKDIISCVSPISSSFSAMSTELEVRCASSLATSSTPFSTNSLSPVTAQHSPNNDSNAMSEFATRMEESTRTADDIDSLLNLELLNRNYPDLPKPMKHKNTAKKASTVLLGVEKLPADFLQNYKMERSELSKPIGRLNHLSPQIKSIATLIGTQLKNGEDKHIGKGKDITNQNNLNEVEIKIDMSTSLPAAKMDLNNKKCENSVEPTSNTPVLPKNVGATEATIEARSRLLQSIKEHVKRID